MKRCIFVLMALSLAISCTPKKANWETLLIEKDTLNVTAKIEYPYCFGGVDSVSDKINNVITETITTPLLGEKNDTIDIYSALELIVKEKFTDSIIVNIPYQIDVSSSFFIDDTLNITSVMINKYYYLGGANGYSYINYLNFDKEGNIRDIKDMIDLNDTLLQEVRTQFCLIRDISIDDSAAAASLFVAPSEINFPEQIGFNESGVVFFYNLYEIAPRSSGTTKVVIPYDKVTLKSSHPK